MIDCGCHTTYSQAHYIFLLTKCNDPIKFTVSVMGPIVLGHYVTLDYNATLKILIPSKYSFLPLMLVYLLKIEHL